MSVILAIATLYKLDPLTNHFIKRVTQHYATLLGGAARAEHKYKDFDPETIELDQRLYSVLHQCIKGSRAAILEQVICPSYVQAVIVYRVFQYLQGSKDYCLRARLNGKETTAEDLMLSYSEENPDPPRSSSCVYGENGDGGESCTSPTQ